MRFVLRAPGIKWSVNLTRQPRVKIQPIKLPYCKKWKSSFYVVITERRNRGLFDVLNMYDCRSDRRDCKKNDVGRIICQPRRGVMGELITRGQLERCAQLIPIRLFTAPLLYVYRRLKMDHTLRSRRSQSLLCDTVHFTWHIWRIMG